MSTSQLSLSLLPILFCFDYRRRDSNFSSLYSGLARTFGRAAFARPTVARRAFEPLRSNALPALSARFASTDANLVGKIHQVIGAVVDGM